MNELLVTLDTNVLVAGLGSRNGASFQVLSHWLDGRFRACVSVPLRLEYEATLKREDVAAHHRLANTEIDVLLRSWAANVVPVELHCTWRPQLRDPKDEMVLDTAVNAAGDAIVTFNRRDFSGPAERFGVELWRPADLLQRLKVRR